MYVAHAAGELPPRDAVRARERVYSSDESEESLASPVRSPRSGSPFSSVSTLSPTRSGIPVRVQRLGIGKEQFALLPRRWSDRRPAPRNKVEQRLRSPGTDLKTSAWAQIIERRSGPCGSRGAAGSAGRTRPDHMVSPRDVDTPAGETFEPKYPFAMGGLPFPVKWEAVGPLDTYCRFPLELKIGGNKLVEVQSAKKAHRGVFEPPKDADGVLRSLRELGGVIIPAEHDDELDWLLRKEGPLQGEKHIINSRRDVETGSIETGTPGRLQVLVRERGKVRLKHWLGEALAETAKRMRECIVRALGVHARILPAELKCGKLRTEQGAPAQPSHYDMYEGATDIECWAAIKPVTGKHRDFYIRPGSHKAVRAGKGIIQAEAKVRVYDDEILLISSLVVHRGGEGPSRDNGAPGCTDQQAVHALFAPTSVPKQYTEDIVIVNDCGFAGEINYFCEGA